MSAPLGSVRTDVTSFKWAFALAALICVILPFLILYWLVPVFSNLTIGNDYGVFPIEHQMALMFSMENGIFPLYVPGFAMGQSATALTLGQLYHPLSYLANLVPDYWKGDALAINTQLRLLSIGITHLVLFHVLRVLGLNSLLAFILSFISIYNLRMLDMFRYGSSLENFTAFIMLCSFIILGFTRFKRRYFVGVAISSYLLTVGGHPQIAYIGFIGAALLTLMTPFFVPAIQPKLISQKQRVLLFWTLVLASTLIGVLLAAPYVFGFYFEFLPYNAIRTNNTYEWAIAYQDSWGGLFKSFYSPLSSNVHGAFGGSSFFMLALVFPLASFLFKEHKASIWFVFFASLFIFLVSAGDATPVHRIVWEYLPMASNFRVPGRFSMMILFPILFLLVWILFRNESHERVKQIVPIFQSNIALLFFIAAGLLLLLNLGLDHFFPAATWPTPDHINDVTQAIITRGMYLGLTALVMAGIYFEMLARRFKGLTWFAGVILACVVMSETVNTLRYGTWVVETKPQMTQDEFLGYMQENYYVSATPGNGMSMALMDDQISRSMYETRIARYYRTVTAISSKEDAEQYLLKERRPDEAVVLAETELTIKPNHSQKSSVDKVDLTNYQYNQLEFDVVANQPGLFATNLPFRENWMVFVDGVQQQVYLANGYEASVFLSKGTHQVTFQYESKATDVGMIVACLILVLAILFLGLSTSNGRLKVVLLLASVFPLLIYIQWKTSLYSEQSLDIQYQWDSSDFPQQNNVSYGKHTVASSIYSTQMSFYYYPGLAVNGDTEGWGFVSAKSNRPHWKVDLGSAHMVNSIRIHKLLSTSLPVAVWASVDNKTFQPIHKISQSNYSDVLSIDSDTGLPAQYIVISSLRNGVLGFHEVEVFGEKIKNE